MVGGQGGDIAGVGGGETGCLTAIGVAGDSWVARDGCWVAALLLIHHVPLGIVAGRVAVVGGLYRPDIFQILLI